MGIHVKKAARHYMRPYRSKIKCTRKDRKKLYGMMESSGEEYVGSNPKASIEELHSYWGNPCDIIDHFKDAVGRYEVFKRYQRSRIIRIIVIYVLLLVIMIIFCIYTLKNPTLTIIDKTIK